jgi:hypothetical protein
MRFALLAVVMVGVLSGCAADTGRGLVPGQSTEAQVEALMGPSMDRRQKGGETVRFYRRSGRDNLAARFGADGKLIALEQRLTEENVALLKPDRSRAEDVRDLLGPPYRISKYPLSQREVWTYPMPPIAGIVYPRILNVEISADQVVRELKYFDDTQRDAN